MAPCAGSLGVPVAGRGHARVTPDGDGPVAKFRGPDTRVLAVA